jgi:hypothetical protein
MSKTNSKFIRSSSASSEKKKRFIWKNSKYLADESINDEENCKISIELCSVKEKKFFSSHGIRTYERRTKST